MPPEFWHFTAWVRDRASTGRVLTVARENPALSASLGLKIAFMSNVQGGLDRIGRIEEELVRRIEERLGTD